MFVSCVVLECWSRLLVFFVAPFPVPSVPLRSHFDLKFIWPHSSVPCVTFHGLILYIVLGGVVTRGAVRVLGRCVAFDMLDSMCLLCVDFRVLAP